MPNRNNIDMQEFETTITEVFLYEKGFCSKSINKLESAEEITFKSEKFLLPSEWDIQPYIDY